MHKPHLFYRLILLFAMCTTSLLSADRPGRASAAYQPSDQIAGVDPDTIAYYPDTFAIGDDGIIYLLSSENFSIFRWSIAQRDYLETIVLDGSPNSMAYASDVNRLYLGYDGQITQIKLDSTLDEEIFISIPKKVETLAVADKFLLATIEEYGNSLNNVNVYNLDGTLTYSSGNSCMFCYHPKRFVWSEVNQRLYFDKEKGSLPEEIYWVQIDASGVISGFKDTPFHGGYNFLTPLQVSPDGAMLLAQGGHLFDAISLAEPQQALSETLVSDAAWNENGLFTLHGTDMQSRVLKWNDSFQPTAAQVLRGSPLRLFYNAENLVAVTYEFSRPWFWILDVNLNIDYIYQPIFKAFMPSIHMPYPIYLSPGTYPINRCQGSILWNQGEIAGSVTECVTSVEILSNGYMKFNFSWSTHLQPEIPYVLKHSDEENRNMYVTDNLDNRYNHFSVGGAAGKALIMYDGDTVEGWFLFTPAKKDATTFAFYDLDRKIMIDQILLTP